MIKFLSCFVISVTFGHASAFAEIKREEVTKHNFQEYFDQYKAAFSASGDEFLFGGCGADLGGFQPRIYGQGYRKFLGNLELSKLSYQIGLKQQSIDYLIVATETLLDRPLDSEEWLDYCALSCMQTSTKYLAKGLILQSEKLGLQKLTNALQTEKYIEPKGCTRF